MVAGAPPLGGPPRSIRGTTAATAALGALLGACALLTAAVARSPPPQKEGGLVLVDGHQRLPLRAVVAASSVRATLFSALSTGLAMGSAESFLPALAVQQGMVLIRAGDLALGWAERRLRASRPRRRVRQLASTAAPLIAAVGLLGLVPPTAGAARHWPGLATACIFFHSPLGFGSGFGCCYREVGGPANAAVVAAMGSLVSTLGMVIAPHLVRHPSTSPISCRHSIAF